MTESNTQDGAQVTESEYAAFARVESPLREKWIETLESFYSDPHRHYHTIAHIKSMFKQLATMPNVTEFTPTQLQILHLAIWFHDVGYKIPSNPGYNEGVSAYIAERYARQVYLVPRSQTITCH